MESRNSVVPSATINQAGLFSAVSMRGRAIWLRVTSSPHHACTLQMGRSGAHGRWDVMQPTCAFLKPLHHVLVVKAAIVSYNLQPQTGSLASDANSVLVLRALHPTLRLGKNARPCCGLQAPSDLTMLLCEPAGWSSSADEHANDLKGACCGR